jgi:hypothetical protein
MSSQGRKILLRLHWMVNEGSKKRMYAGSTIGSFGSNLIYEFLNLFIIMLLLCGRVGPVQFSNLYVFCQTTSPFFPLSHSEKSKNFPVHIRTDKRYIVLVLWFFTNNTGAGAANNTNGDFWKPICKHTSYIPNPSHKQN